MEVFTVNEKTYKEKSHVLTALHATLQALNKMVKIILFMKHILRKAQTLLAWDGILNTLVVQNIAIIYIPCRKLPENSVKTQSNAFEQRALRFCARLCPCLPRNPSLQQLQQTNSQRFIF